MNRKNELPKIRVHPRVKLVREGAVLLNKTLGDIEEKLKLTPSEIIYLLSRALLEFAIYPIKWERHGNYDKKGIEV